MSLLSTLPLSIIKYIRSMWMAELFVTYLHVDKQGLLVSWGGYPRYYGLSDLRTKIAVNEQIMFLEGLLPVEHTQVLEFIGMENGRYAHVHLIPNDSGTWILLLDATTEHQRQQKLQQQLNELSILTYRQSQMMQKLESMRIALLKDKQRLEKISDSKSDFIANLTHELRTPISSLVGYAKLLDDTKKSASQDDEYVDSMRENAEHLLSLVDALLEQSKLETGNINLRPTCSDLTELCNNLQKLFFPAFQEKNLNFEIIFENNLPQAVMIDEIRLRQILINLINNALKFTDLGYVQLSLEWREDKFYFSVVDSGRGIPKEQLEEISYNLQQSNSNIGGGLGLVISNNLVQKMGGKLKIESEANQGSCFSGFVRAPLLDNTELTPTTNDAAPAAHKYQHRQQKLILLAENSPYISNLMQIYLENSGYKVLKISNGLDVLQLLAKHNIDALILDMQLPCLDGYQITQQLRQNDVNIAIIAISASTLPKDRSYALQIGCDAYLIKPIQANTIIELMDRILLES
jgi:signal transduction histidine kinase